MECLKTTINCFFFKKILFLRVLTGFNSLLDRSFMFFPLSPFGELGTGELRRMPRWSWPWRVCWRSLKPRGRTSRRLGESGGWWGLEKLGCKFGCCLRCFGMFSKGLGCWLVVASWQFRASWMSSCCSFALEDVPLFEDLLEKKTADLFQVVIIKQGGITWMPDESLEPLVKELDDTAAPGQHLDGRSWVVRCWYVLENGWNITPPWKLVRLDISRPSWCTGSLVRSTAVAKINGFPTSQGEDRQTQGAAVRETSRSQEE